MLAAQFTQEWRSLTPWHPLATVSTPLD